MYTCAYIIMHIQSVPTHRQVVARCWNASNSRLRMVGMHCPSISQGEENGWLVRVCTGTLGRMTYRRAPLGCRSPVVFPTVQRLMQWELRCHSRNPTTWGQTNQTVNLFTYPPSGKEDAEECNEDRVHTSYRLTLHQEPSQGWWADGLLHDARPHVATHRMAWIETSRVAKVDCGCWANLLAPKKKQMYQKFIQVRHENKSELRNSVKLCHGLHLASSRRQHGLCAWNQSRMS